MSWILGCRMVSAPAKRVANIFPSAFVSLAWWFRDTSEEYHFSFPLPSSSMLITINLISRWWQSALFHLHYSADTTLACLVPSHKKHVVEVEFMLPDSKPRLTPNTQQNISTKQAESWSHYFCKASIIRLFSCQTQIPLIAWQVNPKDERGWSALLLQKQLIKAWIMTMIWCTDIQRHETDLAATCQY